MEQTQKQRAEPRTITEEEEADTTDLRREIDELNEVIRQNDEEYSL